MAFEEAKKRELVAGITVILRQSPLHNVIDTQRLAMAFSLVLDNVEPGQPIDLQHLYQWLISQKAPDKDALELCVVLKLREDKLGAQFTPPAKAQFLDPAVLESLAAKFQGKADRSQAWDRKGPDPAAELPATKQAAWAPKKGAKGKPHRAYPIILALSVAGAIGFWAWRIAIAVPPLRAVVLTDAAGLKCVELKANERVAMCTITREQFAAQPMDAWNTRADVSLRELRKEKGTEIIYVMVENRLKIRRP